MQLQIKNKETLTDSEIALYCEIYYLRKVCSLREIQKRFYPNMSLGTLARILTGTFPKRPELRKKLNLPLLGEGRLCPVHNKVHSRVCQASFEQRLEGNPNRKQILELYYGMVLKINAVDCKSKSQNKNDG